MEKVNWSLGFRNCVAVDCGGRSGGIAFSWRDTYKSRQGLGANITLMEL